MPYSGKTQVLTAEEIKKLSDSFEGKPPQEVMRWALREFSPHIALACSFGAEDVALVDMLLKIDPQAQIFYLDTGVLFPETYQVRDEIIQKYCVAPIQVKPALTLEEQAAQHGEGLWTRNPDLCCNLRKVQPLTHTLATLQAWLTGIRRDQAPTRAHAGIVEWDGKFNLVKVNPLVAWKWEQVWDYIRQNQVPYNGLHGQGYPSIGCQPCTRQAKEGEDPRAGRWSGFGKTECGLHQ